jgi:hypothetical protein
MPTHIVSTSRYLLGTKSVLSAGRQLQSMLGEDADTLKYAVTQLEEAASDQDTGTKGYRAFMFSALDKSKTAQKEKREKITEDVLATVVADLQIGSVLVAAGQAVGEAGAEFKGQAAEDKLDEALASLEETTPVISRGLSGPLTGGMKPGRFNFSGSPDKAQPPQAIESPDVASAIKTFRTLSDQTMETFVSEFRGVAVEVVNAIKVPLKKIKIMEVFEKLGGPVRTAASMIGNLIKKGIQKIQSAIEALVRLIGNDNLTKIKDRIKELWGEIGKKKLNEWGNDVLSKFIGVKATRETIEIILAGELKKDAVDRASNELSQLKQPYNDNMEMAKKAVGAISIVSGVLFLLPIAGQQIALFAALAYLMILSVALLIAMDYCDSGQVLQRVRGVGEIANSLRAAK